MLRLVEGVKMQKRLDPHAHVAVKNWEIDSEVPSKEQGVPAPHQALQLRAPVLGRRAPTAWGCENQQGLHPSTWNGRLLKALHSSKGPLHRCICSYSLTLGSDRWTEAQEAQQTYRERLSCMVSGWGLEGQLPLSLCWALSHVARRWVQPIPGLSCTPTQSKLNLY